MAYRFQTRLLLPLLLLIPATPSAEYAVEVRTKPGWQEGIRTVLVMPVLCPQTADCKAVERDIHSHLSSTGTYKVVRPETVRDLLFELGTSQERATNEQVAAVLEKLQPDAIVTAWVKYAGSSPQGALIVGGNTMSVAIPIDSEFGGVSLEIRRRSDGALLVLASGEGESDWVDCHEVISKLLRRIFERAFGTREQPIDLGDEPVPMTVRAIKGGGQIIVAQTSSGLSVLLQPLPACSGLQVGSKVTITAYGDRGTGVLSSGRSCEFKITVQADR